MRYLKAILVLALALFIIFQVISNYTALAAPVSLVLRLPRILLGQVTFSLATGLILFFALGFLLALSFEVYYWFGYTRTIRQHKKLIHLLQKELSQFRKPSPPSPEKQPPA